MANEYNQICPVVFGNGAIKEIGERAKKFGTEKALCVYDADAKKAAKIVADNLRTLCGEIGIRPLKAQGLNRDEVLSCAKDAIDHNWFVIKTPKNVTVTEMTGYLTDMYNQIV